MNPFIQFLIYSWYVQQMVVPSFFAGKTTEKVKSQDITLVGSTPGDSLVKTMLAIPAETQVDFIRWELGLTNKGNKHQEFILNLTYGESQPNTLGFKRGGQKQILAGSYAIGRINEGKEEKTVYEFKTPVQGLAFSLVRLNDNLFHLLSPGQKLLVGNGGWSYTLNRKDPLPSLLSELPSPVFSERLTGDTALQSIYDGRTPCLDFAREHALTVDPGCFKLKWKLILNRDPESHHPTTYQLKRTNNRESDIRGNWTILGGMPSHPKAVIIQLDPDKPEKSLSLLAGDENVLFFLDKSNRLYTGNGDFSYTLNKRNGL